MAALCPNCGKNQILICHGDRRCSYCGYNPARPHIRPALPQPLQKIKCPECGSVRLTRNAQYDAAGKVLCWFNLCRDCGRKYNPVKRAAGNEQHGYKSKVE